MPPAMWMGKVSMLRKLREEWLEWLSVPTAKKAKLNTEGKGECPWINQEFKCLPASMETEAEGVSGLTEYKV